MAHHLDGAGVRDAHGFSLNVSNYCGVGGGSAAGQFLPEVAYKMVFGY